MRDWVLLLSHSQDFYGIDRVQTHLTAAGANAIRVNTDDFPVHQQISLSFDTGAFQARFKVGELELKPSDIGAVWLRHLSGPTFPSEMDEIYQATARAESSAVMHAWLESIPAERWLSTPRASRHAESKALQMQLAMDCGLEIPKTLITNDPMEVRAFAKGLPGGIIAKMQTPFTQSMGRPKAFFYTSLLQPEEISTLEGLSLCPMIFQECIPKACELRVVYVAGEVFCGAIHASKDSCGHIDWRKGSTCQLAWTHGQLPEATHAALHTFMQKLNLGFGAADFIITPDNRCIFLEINPCGEWGMLERDLDLPISLNIAKALLDRL